jgi:hypothetical protein
MLRIVCVVLQQQFPCLLIQRRLCRDSHRRESIVGSIITHLCAHINALQNCNEMLNALSDRTSAGGAWPTSDCTICRMWMSSVRVQRWASFHVKVTVGVQDFPAEPGKGSMSRQRTMTSTCRRPMSGFQSRLSTFTQISPGFETLGWKILVRKKPAFRKGYYSRACE